MVVVAVPVPRGQQGEDILCLCGLLCTECEIISPSPRAYPGEVVADAELVAGDAHQCRHSFFTQNERVLIVVLGRPWSHGC